MILAIRFVRGSRGGRASPRGGRHVLSPALGGPTQGCLSPEVLPALSSSVVAVVVQYSDHRRGIGRGWLRGASRALAKYHHAVSGLMLTGVVI